MEIEQLFDKKLGFGFMRLPLLSSDPADIDFNYVNGMVDEYLTNGFNYFETAYPYHNHMSETAIRKCLVERYDRASFLLADKMPPEIRDTEWFDIIFNRQLERCGVNFFDFYLLHSLKEPVFHKYEKLGGFDYLYKLKDEGKAKYIGFSFHDSPQVLDEILCAHPEMDFVQLQINYLDMESPHIQSEACYKVARNHHKPIIVMEPVKGGGLVNIADEALKLFKSLNSEASAASFAIRYAASLEGIMLVLSGMSNLQQVQDNVSYMKAFKPLRNEEYEVINKVSAIIKQSYNIQCTTCRYCIEECVNKIPIPDLFSIYNSIKSSGRSDIAAVMIHKNRYKTAIYGKGKAGDCIKCGKCEKACPQYLPIQEKLEEIANIFEN
ncbi:MAG: aldo/keto reductase [Desulfosporosinus sp.]